MPIGLQRLQKVSREYCQIKIKSKFSQVPDYLSLRHHFSEKKNVQVKICLQNVVFSGGLIQ